MLIVDHDVRATQLLAQLLREDGFEVDVLFDGGAALVRLAEGPAPDALVTDLLLRKSTADGHALARLARERQPGVPVFFVTGYPDRVDATSLRGGAPAVFAKPVDYPKLRDALAAALKGAPPRSI